MNDWTVSPVCCVRPHSAKILGHWDNFSSFPSPPHSHNQDRLYFLYLHDCELLRLAVATPTCFSPWIDLSQFVGFKKFLLTYWKIWCECFSENESPDKQWELRSVGSNPVILMQMQCNSFWNKQICDGTVSIACFCIIKTFSKSAWSKGSMSVLLSWLSEATYSRGERSTELCAAQSQLKLVVKISVQVFPQSVWLWSLDSQVETRSTAVLSEFQGLIYGHGELLTSAGG